MTSLDRSPQAARDVGRALPGKFRRSHDAGPCRNRSDRRQDPGRREALRRGDPFGTHERVCPQRGGRERSSRALLRGARPRKGCDGLPEGCTVLLPALGCGRKGSTTRATVSATRGGPPMSDPTTTIHAPVDHLDSATVIKVSEAVSGEIVLEKLIDTLMRTAIEHAGADRGLLILPRGEDYRIEAEATIGSDSVNVVLRQASVTAADLPRSVFQYVVRTKEAFSCMTRPARARSRPTNTSKGIRAVRPLLATTQADQIARGPLP